MSSAPLRTTCSLVLCVMMSNLPNVAVAQHGMIATDAVVAELERAQTHQRVQSVLDRKDVQSALIARGLTPTEASLRLAQLSDSELRQLDGQIQQARAGGTILVEILLVVLIIFLIKRL